MAEIGVVPDGETSCALKASLVMLFTDREYAPDVPADDAKKEPHNITRGQLEEILTRAAALDIPVVGFDELDSISR